MLFEDKFEDDCDCDCDQCRESYTGESCDCEVCAMTLSLAITREYKRQVADPALEAVREESVHGECEHALSHYELLAWVREKAHELVEQN